MVCFSHKVINISNKLPEEVMEADVITTFKRHLGQNRKGVAEMVLMWANRISVVRHHGWHGCD